MATYDIIIVGLGTAGSAACMSLSRRGLKVLGIDALHPPHTRGSHHGASRSVRRAYMEGTAYVPMALASWELWRKLEADTGQTLLIETGNLTLGPPEAPAVSGFLASARSYDIPHDCLTAGEVRKRWPQLAPPDDFIAGLEQKAGIVFPEPSIKAFLDQAEKAGAVFVTGEKVDLWTEEHNRIMVHTSQHTYESGRLLICAGAWTNHLLQFKQSPLEPHRVPVHWVEPPKGGLYALGSFPVNFWQVPIPAPMTPDPSYSEFYALPVIGPHSRIKTAFHNGLVNCDPDTLDRETSSDEAQRIRAVLAKFLPGLDQRSMTSEVCMYTLTPDGHFYLGKIPGSDHVFGVALAGHGFKFAPVLGEMLADLLTDTPLEFDINIFSPNRFRD